MACDLLVARPRQAQCRGTVAVRNDERAAGTQRRDDSRIELRRVRDLDSRLLETGRGVDDTRTRALHVGADSTMMARGP